MPEPKKERKNSLDELAEFLASQHSADRHSCGAGAYYSGPSLTDRVKGGLPKIPSSEMLTLMALDSLGVIGGTVGTIMVTIKYLERRFGLTEAAGTGADEQVLDDLEKLYDSECADQKTDNHFTINERGHDVASFFRKHYEERLARSQTKQEIPPGRRLKRPWFVGPPQIDAPEHEEGDCVGM